MPSAFVIIHCDPAETYYVIRNLKYIPEVTAADDVFGYYEVVCKVEAKTQRVLEKVITSKIRKIKHIISTMTLSVIEGQG
jgi:DNA-binding Lrp family transcriptional regulator